MLEEFEDFIEPIKKYRRVHIYLPDDYHQSKERYPVMYMYDGHNLFRDEEATYGKSWGLQTFMKNYDKKLMIVGIECDHEGNHRLEEYCPYDIHTKFAGDVHGYGNLFMDWFVYQFKPMIDQRYRTIPFRECTAIGGSSMGGLMAYYTVFKYNQYFSKAACLSPSIGMCKSQLKREFKQTMISPDTRVYLSFGTREMHRPGWMIKTLYECDDDLIGRGAFSYLHIIEGGEHNETCWEKLNNEYMDFLWKS